jgi:hypothetical protein
MDLKKHIDVNICGQIYYIFLQIIANINKNINKYP